MNSKRVPTSIKIEIIEIANQMRAAGLPGDFVVSSLQTGFDDGSLYPLLKSWAIENDSSKKEQWVTEIQKVVKDDKEGSSFIRIDDLQAIAHDIRDFKDNLRVMVDGLGGIKNLSKLTGIPQPSLSRFFNTSAMPRRTTLLKISRALKISKVPVGKH